jgi:hypothetical protein
MPSATYNKSIITTNVWSATYSGSGSGTIYTVPTDRYIIMSSCSGDHMTSFNLYVNSAKLINGATYLSQPLNGAYAVSGQTISFDSVGGGGTTYMTIYFAEFKTVSP